MSRRDIVPTEYYGIGIIHYKNAVNVGTLLRSCYAFGASFAFTIGRRYCRQSSDTVNAWLYMPIYNYPTCEDFVRYIPFQCQVIGVEMGAATDLGEFVHPNRAIYILGSEDNGLPNGISYADVVSIRSRVCLNVATAGSIIMYDRAVKARLGVKHVQGKQTG